jgi:uncharacterized protein (TIGR02996 family)
MDDEAALLKAICADPADDTARLVFADFLQELGGAVERAWAAFIRAHVRLVTETPAAGDVPDVMEFASAPWLERFAHRLGVSPESGVALHDWERGFPDGVTADYFDARWEWERLTDHVPFRHLHLSGLDDPAVEDLVLWPRLERLTLLDLTRWDDATGAPRALGERAVAALATCPALAGLEELRFHVGAVSGRVADLVLCSRHLAGLKRLGVTGDPDRSDRWAVARLERRFGPNAVL